MLKNWFVRAGGAANLTLPETYDRNPDDQVKISLTMVDRRNNGLFKIDQNKFLIFNAGFNDLGDIEMIITLTDSNKKPKSSNYRLTVTVLPNEMSEMENPNV